MLFNTKKKTVNEVLASFNQLVDDLESVEKEQQAEVEIQQQTIQYAQAAKDAAQLEAKRAWNIRSKILNLIKD